MNNPTSRALWALDASVEPVASVHDQSRAQVEEWGGERDWDPEHQARMEQRQRVHGQG